MKLYLIREKDAQWDEYDGAIVAAEDERAAIGLHPSGDTPSNWEPNSIWG